MRVALAWGCGTGSLLALDALLAEGREVTLVHVCAESPRPPEDALRRIEPHVVEAQAAALGLPLVLARGAGPEMARLGEAVRGTGAARVAFGYTRGEEYEQYHLAKAIGAVEAMLPVRHIPAAEAARQLVESGHRAFVRAAAPPFDASVLGRFLDARTIDDLDALAGRRGWSALRTFAVSGPRFIRAVDVAAGATRPVEGGWRLGLDVVGC